MKILIVCSGNAGRTAPFIKDQAEALEKQGVEIDFFLIKGKGLFGYLKNYPKLIQQIKKSKADIVHAHYGLSGLLATLQRSVPVIITLHGSDINYPRIYRFSRLAYYLSKHTILVSAKMALKLNPKNNFSIIPCAVDTTVFFPADKQVARQTLNWNRNKNYVLFSSSFNNVIKNYPLAKAAIDIVGKERDIELIELKGYGRHEVALLMNAVDVCLLTSLSEGSSQFIKEAMASGTPVVSIDVGDVKEIMNGTEGCYIASMGKDDIAEKIKSALEFSYVKGKTKGRERLLALKLDAETVAKKIIHLYNKVSGN